MHPWAIRTIGLCALSPLVLAVLPSSNSPETRLEDHSTIEATSQSKQHRLAFFVVGGYPKNSDAEHPITILINEAYAVGHVQKRKNPAWSAYHVDKVRANFNGNFGNLDVVHDRPDPFYTDPRVPAHAQLAGNQTFGSGYDRGHMTPNNAIQKEFGRIAQLETFFMTNMCPQKGSLNSGLWKTLEHKITSELVAAHNDIWVIAGPIFSGNPRHIKKGSWNTGVDIPSGFYMVLVEQTHWSGTLDTLAFRFPNGSTSGKVLSDFVVPIDDIEITTKLDFFSELTEQRQKRLEEHEGEFSEWFRNE